MKYLIIGAGATGGCLAAFMARGGLDVSVIDQGEQLEAIKENGVTLQTNFCGTINVKLDKVYSYDEYKDRHEVVILCLKEYCIDDELIDFLNNTFAPGTLVLPLINVYGTGMRLQKQLPKLNVLDGFTYLIAHTERPGVIKMYDNLFNIVFGVRDQDNYSRYIDKISLDLRCCGIEADVSDDILCDSLRKFSFVSPVSCCGVYFDCTIGEMQDDGEERETVISMMKEIEKLSAAMGYTFSDDIVKNNLGLLDSIKPHALTSMQYDIVSCHQSEIEGLLYNVVKMGEEYNVDIPTYRKVAEALRKKFA